MQDGEFSSSAVIAAALWMWTAGMMACAWLAWEFAPATELQHMFGYTTCASSAVAATAQIRCYVVQVCSLLRDTSLVQEARRVRSLR